ncbi:MAG: hypothetical protein IJS68_01710 [Clostridia bacterium]|nr:hypothetical protein [Clostridia bacterium]
MELHMIALSNRFDMGSMASNYNFNGDNFVLRMVATNFGDLLNGIVKYSPQVVIIDAEYQVAYCSLNDLIEIVSKIYKNDIVIISGNVKKSENYYVVNPFFWKSELVRILAKIAKKLKSGSGSKGAYTLQEIITQRLLKYNLPSNLLGYNYLIKAIEICYHRHCFIKNIKTDIYDKVAKEFGVSADNVERNIRNALNVAKLEHQRKGNKNNYLFGEFCEITNKRFIIGATTEICSSKQGF